MKTVMSELKGKMDGGKLNKLVGEFIASRK